MAKVTDYFERCSDGMVSTKEIASVAKECGGTSRQDSENIVAWMLKNGGRKAYLTWNKTGKIEPVIVGFFLKVSYLMDKEQFEHVGMGYTLNFHIDRRR